MSPESFTPGNSTNGKTGSRQENNALLAPSGSRVIAVASGKGGVGKTNVAINLGLSLARRNYRVAIMDADLGTANVDVVLGIHPRYNLQHVVTGQRSLSEVMVKGPHGLSIIPGASGLPDLVNLPEAQRAALLSSLVELNGQVDILFIDTSAGVGPNVLQFILAAGELLLVTTPEPTAIIDAYALMKMLTSYQAPVSTRLLVNLVRREADGITTGQKLAALAQQFLGRQVEAVGTLPYDISVVDAVKKQTPFLLSYPRSPASMAVDRIGRIMWPELPAPDPKPGIARFFRRMLAPNLADVASGAGR